MGPHNFLPSRPPESADQMHRIQMLAAAVVAQAFTDIGLLAAAAPRLIDRPIRQLARWASECGHWLQDYETLRTFRSGPGWAIYLHTVCQTTDPAVFSERFDRLMEPLAAPATVIRHRLEPHLNRLHRPMHKVKEGR